MAQKIVFGILIGITGLTILGTFILPALVFVIPVVYFIVASPFTWGVVVLGSLGYYLYKLGKEKEDNKRR